MTTPDTTIPDTTIPEPIDDGTGGPRVDVDADEGLGAPTLAAALEALLLVADQPIDLLTLASLTRSSVDDVARTLAALREEYAAQGRGFDLAESGGCWRYYTREDCSSVVERFVRDGQQARLTQAALETLAVVAYRQPVTRSRISAVRGVNVDGVIRTLLTRGLVEETGDTDEGGGHLYRTTAYFLERLGLRSLEDLPPLGDYLPDLESLESQIEELAR